MLCGLFRWFRLKESRSFPGESVEEGRFHKTVYVRVGRCPRLQMGTYKTDGIKKRTGSSSTTCRAAARGKRKEGWWEASFMPYTALENAAVLNGFEVV